jgi:hypothetical protein
MNKRGAVYFAPHGFFCDPGTALRPLKKISFKYISRQSAADFFDLIINKDMEAGL